jgi:transcriptional regulator with XRE-family HTH domain
MDRAALVGFLRREEVAAQASMPADYYTRLEQQRGSQPNEQMLASLARALTQALLVLTAPPRTEGYEKLQLLAVLGQQRLAEAGPVS